MNVEVQRHARSLTPGRESSTEIGGMNENGHKIQCKHQKFIGDIHAHSLFQPTKQSWEAGILTPFHRGEPRSPESISEPLRAPELALQPGLSTPS